MVAVSISEIKDLLKKNGKQLIVGMKYEKMACSIVFDYLNEICQSEITSDIEETLIHLLGDITM